MDTPNSSPVQEILRQRIASAGSITFAEFMAIALYHDDAGYYRQPDRKPGRGGDFMTSPELHPFFGNTLARQIAEAWDALGHPTRMVVREHGASSGGLAYDILVALHEKAPDVLAAINYRLVDVNTHRLNESLVAMAEVGFGDHVRPEHPDNLTPEAGVVLANEVADAFPTHRLTKQGGQLLEMRVGMEGDRFIDVLTPPDPALLETVTSHFGRHGIVLPDGAHFEFSPAAAGWIANVAQSLSAGIAIVIDYGYDAPTLYQGHRLQGTLRGYYQHTVTDDPYLRAGKQDLTAHVDFSYLADTAAKCGMTVLGLTTQSEYLTALGLGEWLVDLQHQPDVAMDEYYLAQAATMRLIDPAGLGRFGVLGLGKNLPAEFRARGFARLSFADELAHL